MSTSYPRHQNSRLLYLYFNSPNCSYSIVLLFPLWYPMKRCPSDPPEYPSFVIFASIIGSSLLLNHSLGEWFSLYNKERLLCSLSFTKVKFEPMPSAAQASVVLYASVSRQSTRTNRLQLLRNYERIYLAFYRTKAMRLPVL